jgi:hypothetical protein
LTRYRAGWIGSLVGVATILSAAAPARAGEGPFAFIYTLDLQPKDTFQFEQWEYLQFSQSQGDYLSLLNRSEFEYGFKPWYQIGLYINTEYTYANRNGVDGTTGGPGTNIDPNSDPFAPFSSFRFKSISFENIIRLTNPYTDGFGFGLYFEPAIGPYGYELEWKFLFQKDLLDDRLVLAANIIFATEQQWQSGQTNYDSELQFILGASYRFADNWYLGVEARNHQEFSGQAFNQPEYSAWFFGPTIHYTTEKWWVTLGWQHQLGWVQAFTDDIQANVVNGKVYGNEQTSDAFMLRVGVPFKKFWR